MDAWSRVNYELKQGISMWDRDRRARAYAAAITITLDDGEDK